MAKKKSPTQRIERLEDICMGMGFLLKKLRAVYGGDFGVGMNQQVNEAIRDYEQIAKSRQDRDAAAALASAQSLQGAIAAAAAKEAP